MKKRITLLLLMTSTAACASGFNGSTPAEHLSLGKHGIVDGAGLAIDGASHEFAIEISTLHDDDLLSDKHPISRTTSRPSASCRATS